jgi:DNA-directed RNA polymerase specialized sigma24 family protein
MGPGLTATTFASLLDHLDADRDRAGERYEVLRRTLTRFFEWRGAPFPEEHADETFNRVARKLGEGVDIKNIGGYCYEVARLVFLETLKGPDSRRAELEAIAHKAAAVDLSNEAAEKEAYLSCLEVCLEGLPAESRELIVEYYRDDKRGRSDRRKELADRLGLRREALANRAQRLRGKLELCVNDCLKKKPTI